MASSNRHWPSMFKSKPCNSPLHQWHHDINPSLCHRSAPYPTGIVLGGEERSPEPKPRWNPRPEQIRILESIFNSGMVNPPRDEIRRIRAQLQEYGQVGDANVFYWFQNRKSRTKHKLRHPTTHATSSKNRPKPNPTSTSSSSSSDASSFPLQHPQNAVVLNAPLPPNNANNNNTAAYSSSSYGQFVPFITEAAVVEQGGVAGFPSDLLTFLHHHELHEDDQTAVGDYLLSEMKKEGGGGGQQQKMMLSCYSVSNNNASTTATADQIHPTPTHSLFVPPPPLPGTCSNVAAPTISQSHQGLGEPAGLVMRSTVFINDVAFDVPVGPFNVRDAFGDDALLLQSSGHPVVTDEWGVTLHPLQHGAFYYLVRTLTPLPERNVSPADMLAHELPC